MSCKTGKWSKMMRMLRSKGDAVAPSLQQVLLARFGVGNLVDHQAHTALGNDIGGAVSQLDRHNGLGCREAEHREQVHDWVCAPADHCHHLRRAYLGCDHWVRFARSRGGKADEELVDDVQEESHGGEPADPTRSQVASDNKLTVIT